MKWLIQAIVLLCIWPAMARDYGQYENVDPKIREWFRGQIIPGGQFSGKSCCNEADGTKAQEDIRDGRYWAKFEAHGVPVDWMIVPDEAVLTTPNLFGAPVVWFWFENGQPRIRCFAPGPKM